MSLQVKNNPKNSRYELLAEGHIAVADYVMEQNRLVITHVGVPAALENRGIGSALVKAVLEDARAKHLKIRPLCSFAATYIKRHPEYADLL